MYHKNIQQGFSLPVVLGLVVVLTLLLQVIVTLDRQDSILSVQMHRKKQLELYHQSAKSALEFQYIHFGIQPQYNTITKTFQNPDQGYRFTSQAFGLWHQAQIQSFWKNGVPPLELTQNFNVFQKIDSLPTLILLDSNLELEIGKDVQIEGTIALKTGIVRPSSRYEIRYNQNPYSIKIKDSTWKNLNKWTWSTYSAREWLKHFKDPDTSHLTQKVNLKSNTYHDTLIFAHQIQIQDSSHFENCLLYAHNIKISGYSTFKNCQIIAQDSMLVHLKTKQNNLNYFWLNPSIKDTLTQPLMNISKYSGWGEFIVADTSYKSKKNYTREGLLFKGDTLDMIGLILVYGEAEVHGQVQGTIAVRNLSNQLNNTIWKGFILQLHLSEYKENLQTPLIFPNFSQSKNFFYDLQKP